MFLLMEMFDWKLPPSVLEAQDPDLLDDLLSLRHRLGVIERLARETGEKDQV